MLIVMFTSEDIRERVAKICRVFDAHVYDVTATTTDQVAGYLEANECGTSWEGRAGGEKPAELLDVSAVSAGCCETNAQLDRFQAPPDIITNQ